MTPIFRRIPTKYILQPTQSLQAYIGLICLGLASFLTLYMTLVSLDFSGQSSFDVLAPFNNTSSSSRALSQGQESALEAASMTLGDVLGGNTQPHNSVATHTANSTGAFQDPEVNSLVKHIELQRGDTLSKILLDEGIVPADAGKLVAAFTKIYPVKQLRPGHVFTITYKRLENNQLQVGELSFRASIDKVITLERQADGTYKGRETQLVLEKELRRVSGLVNTSVFASMYERGIPAAIINSLIQAFSYDIDFQRDVRPDDSFHIVAERYYDPQSGAEKVGDVLFAALNIGGKDYKLYAFNPKSAAPGFYNEKGESVKKAFLRTPVDGARITSGFGNRVHPVLGYTKMHKGVDFAATVGTPILAAGDGVVERAGRFGAYGNYVRIKHTNGYATAYAHLSKFGPVKAGSRVKQGTIIGYVGATGRTTGPHLHFEVLKNGVQINPKLLKNFSVGAKLAGADMKSFQALKGRVTRQMASLKPSATVLTKLGPAGDGALRSLEKGPSVSKATKLATLVATQGMSRSQASVGGKFHQGPLLGPMAA